MAMRENRSGRAALRFDEMSRTERVAAAVSGAPVDRVPVCFWHHFQPRGSGRAMAAATLDFFDDEFDLDIVKIMPDLPYPFPNKSVRTPDEWRLFEPIDPGARFATQRAEAVQLLRTELGPDSPIVMTVFSPLAELMYAAVDRETFLAHLQESPVVLHQALSVVAENLREHLRDMIDAGADGIFFSIQGAAEGILTREQYREFGRPYDLLALQGVQNGWLNVLHVHGERGLYFDDVLDYPVQVMNWSDRLAGPSLREARMITSKCLMGGWHEFGPLSKGPIDAIQSEAEDAMAQTGGKKFILANGCSVPDDTDHQWLHAARDIAQDLEMPA